MDVEPRFFEVPPDIQVGQEDTIMEQEEEMEWETCPTVQPKSVQNEASSTQKQIKSDEIQSRHTNSRHSSQKNKFVNTETTRNVQTKLVVVPDTNIWIGYIDVLKTLLRTKLTNEIRPTIVIPWMVLQELDLNKTKNDSSTESPKLGSKSRETSNFIYQLLSSRNPQVIGQKASDAALSEDKFEAKNCDDQILLCALQCADKYPDALIVFLTNDRNLLIKALIESSNAVDEKLDKILVCDSSTVIQRIKEKLPKENSNERRILAPRRNLHKISGSDKRPKVSSTPDPPTPILKPAKRSHSNKTPSNEGSPSKDTPSSSLPSKKSKVSLNTEPLDGFESIVNLLQCTLTKIIETQMKEDFGEFWLRTVKIKPPWTLDSGLRCLIAHWIAVFSYVFGTKALIHAKSLLELLRDRARLRRSSSSPSATELKQNEEDIVEMAISLLNSGKLIKSAGSHHISTCRERLLDYLKNSKL